MEDASGFAISSTSASVKRHTANSIPLSNSKSYTRRSHARDGPAFDTSPPLSSAYSHLSRGPSARLTSHEAFRKKPKSISIIDSVAPFTPAHMLTPATSNTTSLPSSIPIQGELEDLSSIDPDRPSSPKQHSRPGSIHQRSPSAKRKPPASHSSYGVGTSLGPPPSYTTQRTLSQDRVRTLERDNSARTNVADWVNTPLRSFVGDQNTYNIQNPADFIEQRVDHIVGASQQTNPTSSSLDVGPDISTDTVDHPDIMIVKNADTMAANSDRPVLMEESVAGEGYDDAKMSSGDEYKGSEDLFLNIAKSDTSKLSQPNTKITRRSRISLPFLSSSRPSALPKHQLQNANLNAAENEITLPGSAPRSTINKRSSLGLYTSDAISKSFIEDSKLSKGRPTDSVRQLHNHEEAVKVPVRRYSNTNTDTLRPPTRSFASRQSRLISESTYERPKVSEQVTTESTISTTAPSTVWDELDDLKSRIRKLEFTGQLPPSSAAAMSSIERPRTATTVATNLSSSPKHKFVNSPLITSAVDGIPATIHPLLHEALGNTKPLISQEVYSKLHATAQDALQLSVMMNDGGVSVVGNSMSMSSERQIRRQTESLCRSLTELTIALLADSRLQSTATTRPVSKDAHSTAPSGLRTRHVSNEIPERAPVASRVQSRLESRRTSLHASVPGASQLLRHDIPAEPTLIATPVSVASLPSTVSSRPNRASGLVRHRRSQGPVDDTEEGDEPSPLIRPASRALTESGSYRQTARDRAQFSREYTKQHPLPPHVPTSLASKAPASTVGNSTLTSRRTYAPPGSVVDTQDSSPITPAQRPTWGNITIERPGSGSVEVTPESALARNTGGRRSIGLASKISNVGSRLRAVRSERNGNIAGRDSTTTRLGREMTQSEQDNEGRPHDERHDVQLQAD